jgi:hypothetical protein
MSNFNLKSGNATPFKQMGSSPAKQSIGGDAGEAVDHWKKYKSAKKAPQATFKPTAKPKIATGYGKSTPGAGVVDKIKSTKSTPTSRALKAFKSTPKHLAKGVTKKAASRAIPIIGEALMVGDIIKGGIKNIKEGKTKLPEAKATKFSGGKTWTKAKKDGKKAPSHETVHKPISKSKTKAGKVIQKVGRHVKGEAKEAVRQFKDESVFTKKGRSYQKGQKLDQKTVKTTEKYSKKMKNLAKKKEIHGVKEKYRSR